MRRKQPNGPTPRRIVGISLAPEVAESVKAEAKRRGLRLRDLFRHLWSDYGAAGHPPVSNGRFRSPTPRARQTVGFSLPPELAEDLKAEAKRQRVTLRTLFEGVWARYKSP